MRAGGIEASERSRLAFRPVEGSKTRTRDALKKKSYLMF